ncbi:MAG: ABC transporter permease [Oliverpabstia sp.]
MSGKKSFLKKITGSREASLVIVLFVLGIVVTILNPTFFSLNNVGQIFRNNALTMIMAAGMLCVLLTGGIDISVTSILALSGMTVGLLQKYDVIHNVPLLFLIGIAIGVICGIINGLIISYGKVTPIICTMGFMYIWRGMAYVISNNKWASGNDVSGAFADFGKEGSIGPYIILVIVYVVFLVIMRWTSFGRSIYAVGSNKEAAKVSGIHVERILISTYAMMGILAGLSGVLSVSIYASAQPNMQYSKEMDVIAACVIGGTSMNGGRGSVVGTFLGALIIAIIAKALPLVGIDAIAQNLVKGIIILVVIVLNIMAQRTIDKREQSGKEI